MLLAEKGGARYHSGMLRAAKETLSKALLMSQGYLKTDMLYLASGSFWLGLGQVVSSLCALLLAVAFANLVSPETYGTYKYVLSLAGLMAIFSLPGMNTALARSTAQGRESALHAATRARVLHACVGSLFALAGSAYYFLNGNIELALALLVIAATLPLFDTLTSYLFYFVGKRRFDLRTRYYALTQIASTLVLVATLFFTDDLVLLLLAYFVPLTVIRAALYARFARAIPRASTEEEDAEVKRYGMHLTAMQVLTTIANEVDKVLIWKFLGPAQVAVYTFALAIPEQVKGPLKGVGELAFPKFAGQTPEEVRRNRPALFRKLALYAFALLVASLLYVLIAPYVFAILFPQYAESIPFSQLFALSIVANVASIPIALLSAQQKTKAQYVIAVVQPVITIGLLIALIPPYGIMGAVIALLAGKFATVIISLAAVRML